MYFTWICGIFYPIIVPIFVFRLSIQMCIEDHGEELTAETPLHRLSATATVLLVREGGRIMCCEMEGEQE